MFAIATAELVVPKSIPTKSMGAPSTIPWIFTSCTRIDILWEPIGMAGPAERSMAWLVAMVVAAAPRVTFRVVPSGPDNGQPMPTDDGLVDSAVPPDAANIWWDPAWKNPGRYHQEHFGAFGSSCRASVAREAAGRHRPQQGALPRGPITRTVLPQYAGRAGPGQRDLAPHPGHLVYRRRAGRVGLLR